MVFKPQEIKVYPNPASDYINIELPDGEEAQYPAFSADGVVIRNLCSINSGKISTSMLSPGLYILNVLSKSHVKQTKLIIQKVVTQLRKYVTGY